MNESIFNKKKEKDTRVNLIPNRTHEITKKTGKYVMNKLLFKRFIKYNKSFHFHDK